MSHEEPNLRCIHSGFYISRSLNVHEPIGVLIMKIQIGQCVVCKDIDKMETVLFKDRLYWVSEVSHRGMLIKVEGISVDLAASRFVPLMPIDPMDISNVEIKSVKNA